MLLPGEENVAEATLACLTKIVLDAPRAPRHISWASSAAAFTPTESLNPVPKAELTLFRPNTVVLALAHWATALVVVIVAMDTADAIVRQRKWTFRADTNVRLL